MRVIYQRIMGLMLKRYRKEMNVSLRELSDTLNIAHSHLSRMENHIRPIRDYTADFVMKELKLGHFDEKEVDTYRSDFDEFYNLIVSKKMKEAHSFYKTIRNNRTKIKKTILRYHYDLYDFVYRVYFDTKINNKIVENIISNSEFYMLGDSKICNDTLGLYYKNKKMIDEAERYYDLAMQQNDDSIPFAMASYHTARISYLKGDYFQSYRNTYEACTIFEKNEIYNRILQCKIVFGLIYSAIGDDEKAISVLAETIGMYADKEYYDSIYVVFHNLLYCCIRSKKYAEVEKVLSSLTDDDLKKLDDETYTLMLYYAFVIEDEQRFKSWYLLAPKNGKYPQSEMIVDILKEIMLDGEELLNIEKKIMRLKRKADIDNETLSLANHILLKIYHDSGHKDKELSQYALLYDKDL